MQMDKLFKRNCYAVFMVFLVVHASWGYASNGNQSDTEDETESEHEQNLPVFTLNYSRIQMPLEITLWILLASFAKIGMLHLHSSLYYDDCVFLLLNMFVNFPDGQWESFVGQ